MKVSYIKTQWWRLLFAILCFVIACCYLFSPAIDESTLEGLKESLGTAFAALAWILYSVFWLLMSFVSYNEDCIQELNRKNKELEQRILALEEHAITDIEEVSKNNFKCVRRFESHPEDYIIK